MKKTGNLSKFVARVLVLALAAGCFTGCGKKDDGNVELSVGNWPNAEAEPKRYEIYEGRRADFEANNPGIVIKPDEWKYDVQTFLAKAEGKTLPDLYFTHFTEIKKIIDGGYSADIKDALVKFGYYDKIDEKMLKLIENKDGVFLLPPGRDRRINDRITAKKAVHLHSFFCRLFAISGHGTPMFSG